MFYISINFCKRKENKRKCAWKCEFWSHVANLHVFGVLRYFTYKWKQESQMGPTQHSVQCVRYRITNSTERLTTSLYRPQHGSRCYLSHYV
jgi:hypothetical protein